MTAPLFELLDAGKTYGVGDVCVRALNHVSVAIGQGEFVALTGPSGSGKSTLLNVLGGLEPLSTGSLRFAGTPVHGLDAEGRSRFRHSFIGFVFQAFNLLRRTTALENVELPLAYRRVPRRARRERALCALEQVGLADRAGHMVSQLSGGQQQRVAIARALVCEPPVLLADEPTGNLDSKHAADILDLLRHANAARGTTIIMVTHDRDIAGQARRLIAFRDGRIVADNAGVPAHAA
jgi:putative ABC transport system ATP-binding protein